jgi:hypothetical protein
MPDISAGLRQTVVFAAALVLLFFGAHGGAPRARVVVLFVVFVVAATVWVRGQYADYLDDDSWLLPFWGAVGLGVLGSALMVIFFFFWRLDGLGLAAAILVYFGVGYLVTRWRLNVTVYSPWGYGLLVVGLVVGAGGFALLGHLGGSFHRVPLVLLLVSALLLVPIGLTLVSEQAIAWLSAPGDRQSTLRLWGGVGGAVLFAAAAVIASLWAASSLVFVVLVALGLAVVAVASGTQADIVAVLAVLALMGVTPQQASIPDALKPGGDSKVLVALGDSYMSGEGASIYYKGTDDGGGDQCRRSPTSWAAMAGQQRPFDGLAFLACSGARTVNVNLQSDVTSRAAPALGVHDAPDAEPQPGEPGTQLTQYRELQQTAPFTPSLVVLSLGGNDAGFSTIGLMCVAPGNCDTKASLWNDGLDQVEERLRVTYAEVRRVFPNTPVVVTAYPEPIDEEVAACGQVSLSAGERQFITDFVASLNDRVKSTAAEAEFGFYYLGAMQQALATSHLQLCDPLNDGRPGLNFIGLRSVNGVAEQRFNPARWAHSSLHPNEWGHAAMLRVFEGWLAENEPLSARAPESGTATAGDGQTGTTGEPGPLRRPPCDLFDVSPSGCRPQGQAWAEGQVGRMMLTQGLVALPVAFGAWAASVAFFGWRRKLALSANAAAPADRAAS